jgi:F-type H+-transporting ATPase subunit a
MASIHAPTLASETVAIIAGFPLRNTLIMAWLAIIVLSLIALATWMTGYKRVPGRFQALMEMIVEGLFNFFDGVMQNPSLTRRLFPMVATFFLFIISANWMGILPGVGSITVEGMKDGHATTIPLLRSMNADLNVTLAFTIVSVVATQILGITTIGLAPHLGKYFVMPWKKPYVVGTFVGVLELISEFSRIVSFSFRLFGNIFAGEVLLIVIFYLFPFILPIPFLGMEIFVGFIQAVVFTLLTLVFIKMAMSHHETDGHA